MGGTERPRSGSRGGAGRRIGARLCAAVVVTLLVGAATAPPVAAQQCDVERRYEPSATELPPPEAKYRALITAVEGPAGCGCIVQRPWAEGMAVQAVDSLKAAMDAKEAEAIANYAQFGVSPTGVPLHARTIWFRSTWRSWDEQACLYARLGARQAARPGTSRHQYGIAVDLEDWEPAWGGQDERLLRNAGWCRTVAWEGWHFEYSPILAELGQLDRCIK